MSNYLDPNNTDRAYANEGWVYLKAEEYYTMVDDLVSDAQIKLTHYGPRDVLYAEYTDSNGERHNIEGPSGEVIPTLHKVWAEATKGLWDNPPRRSLKDRLKSRFGR